LPKNFAYHPIGYIFEELDLPNAVHREINSMEENYSFLPFLIDEEIFLVKEPGSLEVDTTAAKKGPNQNLTEQERVVDLIYQGKNLKHMVALVDHPEVDYMNTQQELLLRNILSAMNLNLNDIALINLAHINRGIGIADLEKADCRKLIGFGIGSEKLMIGKKIDANQLVEINGIQFLLSYPLDDLQNDKQKKMTLWRNLKVMFNL
jgi:hypothetical protein